jgi:tripartite-type tricarboxylate transporter receptor subunit TctC
MFTRSSAAVRARSVVLAGTVVATALAAGRPAGAQSVEDFYRGKQLDLIIGYSPGGAYELYARLIARHLGNFIPGKPTIVPRNMPGAGTRIAAAWVYNIAPRTGTVLATVDQALPLAHALGDKNLRIDTTKLIYIGNPIDDVNTTVAWHTSGIKTIEDARRKETVVGSAGSSTSLHYPRAMNALVGTKFKIVTGYPGGNEINIALERGEIDVRGSNSWGSWKSGRPEWVAQKKINVLVQIGLRKAADLPDVPLLMELGSNDEDRAILRLLSASATIGRPLFTTPDVPADRVQALRNAFNAVMKDPAFLEQAQKQQFDINPISGEELQAIVQAMVGSTPRVISGLRRIIAGDGAR